MNHFPSLICVDEIYYENNISICINNEGNLFSYGYSDYKSHGHKNKEIVSFKQIQGLINITMFSCGKFHSVCINNNGDVYSFGLNSKGQLGIGERALHSSCTHVHQKINIPPCKQVSCGYNFTVCLTEDNQLYSFGDNHYGQLGLGSNRKFKTPQLIPDLSNIEYIVCGYFYCICKTNNNEFYSWGNNEDGQLGQGNNHCFTPTQCLNWPDNIINIKCCSYASLLLTSKGEIYSFGNNVSGQLGIKDKNIKSISTPTLIEDIPEIQRIECADHHSICIDINNNLWVFGSNYYGQLGLGDKKTRYKPIQHPTLSNIIDISSGGHHTFVKTIDNKIYGFGDNFKSQLGIKTSKKEQLTPIQVLEGHEDIWCSFIGKSKQKSARK